jgi:hypothetical protein
MGINLAVAFNAAVDQVQNSAKNLQAINDAKVKRQREDEVYQLSKKKAELDIKSAELKGGKTKIELDNLQAMSDMYFKNQNDIIKGKDALINQTEHEETTKLKQSNDLIKTIMPKLIQNGIQPVMLPSGGVTFKPVVQNKERTYDEVKVGKRAIALANKELIESGEDVKSFKESNPQGYSDLIRRYIPKSEEFFYGKATTKPFEEENIDMAAGVKAGLKYGGIISESPKGKVKVISPSGKVGYIPSENLDKALQRGFKRAE